jgi:hypothetical protein
MPESDPSNSNGGRRQTDAVTAVLAVGILIAMGGIYAGLMAGGEFWPVYIELACAAPLILLALVTLARPLASAGRSIFSRRSVRRRSSPPE